LGFDLILFLVFNATLSNIMATSFSGVSNKNNISKYQIIEDIKT
jgi:hypothetical protein